MAFKFLYFKTPVGLKDPHPDHRGNWKHAHTLPNTSKERVAPQSAFDKPSATLRVHMSKSVVVEGYIWF